MKIYHFRLGFIIINPDYRKQGYGKKIINEAIEYAKKKYNAKNFNLGVFVDNENALNCYLNAGFKIIDIEKMFSNFMTNIGIVLKWFMKNNIFVDIL